MNLQFMSPYSYSFYLFFSLPLYLSQNFKERVPTFRPTAAYQGLEPSVHPYMNISCLSFI